MDTTLGSTERLPVRVSARGVIAGVLVGLALAATVMALGTAIGASAMTAPTRRAVGVGFAGWFLLSLACGDFAGGWIAAGGARSLRRRDGALQALVVWAAIALVSLSLVGNVMRGAAVGMLGDGALGPTAGGAVRAGQVGAWGAFAALVLPMLAALAGSLVGVTRERRVAGIVAPTVERRAPRRWRYFALGSWMRPANSTTPADASRMTNRNG